MVGDVTRKPRLRLARLEGGSLSKERPLRGKQRPFRKGTDSLGQSPRDTAERFVDGREYHVVGAAATRFSRRTAPVGRSRTSIDSRDPIA